MRFFLLASLFFIASISLITCQQAAEKKTTNVPPVYKNLEVRISGMTCEIGCAKTIESKVSKMKGVRFSKVIFKDSIGQFTYDANRINAQAIIDKIDGIGDGKLYKVTGREEITSFDTK